MKIKFLVPDGLRCVASRLFGILGIEESDCGIELRCVHGERVGASLYDGVGTVYYRDKHQFFRELGVFVENARKKDAFEINEDGFFKTVGYMFNATNASPTVETLKSQIDYLALMGYNLLMLYTEDTVELEGRPYFGYMQGKYTKEELVALDDYAYAYGIEMIPCLECYGHMQKYLYWSEESSSIKDTDTVLLARSEDTFAFLEELIAKASSCFRSKRIHIGMDEAWNMGRGKFLDENGFVEPFVIFREYMERLVKITDKYGLSPMMWSDMYMRIASETSWPYDEKIAVTDELRASVPEGVDLVFWHYGEEPYCDEFMLEKHNQLRRKVIMATGLWDWSTKLPDNEYAFDATRFSLSACRKTNVREMMTTRWGDADPWVVLLGLSFTAELCYRADACEAEIKERFNFISDGAYDAFSAMGQFNNIFDEEHKYEDYSTRFLGYALYWQDILEGTYDSHLQNRPISQHYYKMADSLKSYKGKWELTVEYARRVFELIAKKSEIAEKLWSSYQSGDKEMLGHIANELLPGLLVAIDNAYEIEYRDYLTWNKQANLSAIDRSYGALLQRAKTAKRMLDDYIGGRLDKIDALEERRLYRKINGFLRQSNVAKATP